MLEDHSGKYRDTAESKMSRILGKGSAVEMYKRLESTMKVDADLLSDNEMDRGDDNYDISDASDQQETPDPDKLFGVDNAADLVFTTEVDPAMYQKK